MSNAISGMGTAIRRNGVEIAEVFDISGPELSAETIDVTHLKSPEWWREFIGSLKDGGEITFSINLLLTDPTHNAAAGVLSGFAGLKAPPVDTWSIVFPDESGTTFSMPGILTGYRPGATVDDKLAAEISVKVAGKPTLA